MAIQTTNPTTGQVEQTFTALTDAEATAKIDTAAKAFVAWRQRPFTERAEVLRKVAAVLRENKVRYGALITTEMGKPKAAAEAEIEKSAQVCDYYAEHGADFLAPDPRENQVKEALVRFDPIGVVLAVMPWNFPFWQVMRFASPAIMAGNVGLLKHASNVPQCALAIEEAFLAAGAPVGIFTTLLIDAKAVEAVIRHPQVQAVALTGSEKAGASVAAIAGSEIKKSLLELGGSDPFIVRADADIEKTAVAAVQARFQNSGQSCIAAKRFIVHAAVADKFLAAFATETEKLIVGDPSDVKTTTGPIVDEAALENLQRQISQSIDAGATCVTGGKRLDRLGSFMAPTILTNVSAGMPVYTEETFGPIAAVIVVADDAEAIAVANDTRLGLAASIWTVDTKAGKDMAAQIDAGSVFINTVVVSDILLPFGGTKRSGYGRELGKEGIFEFVNVKTVKVNSL